MLPTGYKILPDLVNSIEKAEVVLIVSHKRPDYDAVCSSLALYRLLTNAYPDKKIVVGNEDSPSPRMKHLEDYNKIHVDDLSSLIRTYSPQLIICLDGSLHSRFTWDEKTARDLIIEEKISTAVIDHHTSDDITPDAFDIYVNNKAAATSEELYKVFIQGLGWKLDSQIAEYLQLGILSDTNRFLYKIGNFIETAKIVNELMLKGAEIQRLSGKVDELSDLDLQVFQEMFKNLQITDSLNYSFVSDKFSNELQAANTDYTEYKLARRRFVDDFVTGGKNGWGFIVARDWKSDGLYNGSFRSNEGIAECDKLANLFDGGGHKLAAGFDLEAGSVDEAIQLILQRIDKYTL
ncbi:hypothetical protein GF357_01990 [Candidatus Dojkabacteria bacterium]|nr:hypothetical protein [Candidatus Dojkabacteria bacterium]